MATNALAPPVYKPLLYDPCHRLSAPGKLFCLPEHDADIIKADPELWTGTPFSFLQPANLHGDVKGINLAPRGTEEDKQGMESSNLGATAFGYLYPSLPGPSDSSPQPHTF